jgi:hypothetical protein
LFLVAALAAARVAVGSDGPALGAAGAEGVHQKSDSFPHDRHKKLACLTCHLPTSQKVLTFQPPRGCQICHHQSPQQADCKKCHPAEVLDRPMDVRVTITVPKHDPRARTVGYQHSLHDKKKCIDCHVTPVTMEPSDSVVKCQSCHTDHHQSGRRCATCHQTSVIREPHEAPIAPHYGCDRCHTPARIAALEPTRTLCLVCHSTEQDHHESKQCTECHFLASPEEFRTHLSTAAGSAP